MDTKALREAHQAEIDAALAKFKADGNKVTQCVPHGKPRTRKLKVNAKTSDGRPTEHFVRKDWTRREQCEISGYVRADGRAWFVRD